MVSLPRNKGGQFAPEYDGHFTPESTDHFASDLDGQYQRNLHNNRIKGIHGRKRSHFGNPNETGESFFCVAP
jgi:hypothetical protein